MNRLNKELNVATSPISEAVGRGVHTTRHVELFKYKTSLIADTPGFSAIDIDSLTKEEIKNTFPEFKVKCEYDDCMHIKEPNCVVRKLTEEKRFWKVVIKVI